MQQCQQAQRYLRCCLIELQMLLDSLVKRARIAVGVCK